MSSFDAFMPVLLWTDLLLWALILVVTLSFFLSLRNPGSWRAWRKVGENPAAMASLVFLLVFLGVGLLDSLHYRPRLADAPGGENGPAVPVSAPAYAVEVLSVLDLALDHLRSRNEKTYSAPLAVFSYAKEAVEAVGPDGSVIQSRNYPRLKYGGAHLGQNADGWAGDIAGRLLQGVVAALCIGILLTLLITRWLAWRQKIAWGESWRRIRQGQAGFACRSMLAAMIVVLLSGCLLAALSVDYHPFGTDKVGEDILYQVLKSVRTALVIGLVTTVVLLPLAVGLGISAGYFRGWVDDLIQYVYTTINSVPGVLLIAASVLMMQVIIDTHPQWFTTSAERADLRLLALCAILGMTSWTGLARLLRGETLKLRELEYVQAARAFGVSHFRILVRHILPNLMHIVIISLVMDFSGLVLAEAVLSYIGIGVDPQTTSFGMMINNARMELSREPMVWWTLYAAFAFMFALVLAANLLADAIRDAFDPRAA